MSSSDLAPHERYPTEAVCNIRQQNWENNLQGEACGDMTWEFGSESNLDKLLEYERRLEEFMRTNPALSVCLYHRDTLPEHAVETALVTHPSFYVSASLSESNSRYYRIPRKSSLGAKFPARKFNKPPPFPRSPLGPR